MADSSTSRIEAAREFEEPDRQPMRKGPGEKSQPKPVLPAGERDPSLEAEDELGEIETHTLDTTV